MQKAQTARRRVNYSEIITGYAFVAPILILMAVWFYYPVIRSLIYSFQDISFLNPDRAKFIGLSNYINILRDTDFLNAIKISAILTFIAVPVQSALALVIAASLNHLKKWKAFFRTLYFIPYITSTVAVTTVFMYLFMEREGIVTRLFTLIGFPDVSWYADMELALPFLTILYVWSFVGFFTVIYLSGLQTIPNEIYESATVDGTNVLQKFFRITLPMLKPVTFLVLCSGMIYAMQVFDQPYALSRGTSLGGPAGATSTMVIYFYNQAFRFNKAGYGSAAAFIIFLIILIITFAQKKFFEKEEA